MTAETLSAAYRSFIALLVRSPDIGDGWRKVSPMLMGLVEEMSGHHPDLFELAPSAVRLTPDGPADTDVCSMTDETLTVCFIAVGQNHHQEVK